MYPAQALVSNDGSNVLLTYALGPNAVIFISRDKNEYKTIIHTQDDISKIIGPLFPDDGKFHFWQHGGMFLGPGGSYLLSTGVLEGEFEGFAGLYSIPGVEMDSRTGKLSISGKSEKIKK